MAGTKVAVPDGSTRQFLPPCRVCGDRAAGFHYGVNTCEACKGFFHRSLRRYKEYKCRANRTSGYCEYKPGKRKSCQYCRYQRCLYAGMSKDAIKTGRYTYIKRTEDTQEIKRLQDLEYRISSDGQTVDSVLLSSSLSNSSTRKCYNAELSRNDYHADTIMEVDFTATDKYDASCMAGNDLCCSVNEISSSEALAVTKSLISENRKCHINSNKNGCQGNQAQSTKESPHSSSKHSANSSGLSTNGHMSCAHQLLALEKLDFSASQDSDSDQKDNLTLLSVSETSHLDIIDFPMISHTLMEAVNQIQPDGSSVIHILLSNTEVENRKDLIHKNKLDSLELYGSKELDNLNIDSLADTDNATESMDSAVNESHQHMSLSGTSVSVSSSFRTLGSGSKNMIVSSFDLFPEISFCLEGQPLSSPTTSMLSEVMGTSSVLMTSPGLLSPSTSQSPQSNMSSVSSPGAVMLNLDSGKRLKVDDDFNMASDLCNTPEPSCLEGDEMLVLNEDNITLKIMEDYTHGLDFMVDSPGQMKAPTPVQTLLTSPSPQQVKTVSPLSSTGSDLNCPNQRNSTSNLVNRVQNLQLLDVSEMYSDKDAVIATLVASHKENIGNFKFLPKEEMKAQQEAHYEACQLKKQTFGDLGFLPEQEYDDIYSATGIDVDNRRMIIQKYLSRMEMSVRGLVLFAKAIPCFSILDINTQVELIKLARSEIGTFTMYPSVNLELGVTLGLTGEHWTCNYEMGKIGYHLAVTEYMILCDKLQKLSPTEEEEVLLKAIIVVTTDRDSSVSSSLAEVIRWQLVLCLIHSLEKHRKQPGLFLARYILALTHSRTVAETMKDFFRELKMQKYSSIEQNPLLCELFSGILQEKEGECNWDKLCQHIGEGKIAMWSPCLLE